MEPEIQQWRVECSLPRISPVSPDVPEFYSCLRAYGTLDLPLAHALSVMSRKRLANRTWNVLLRRNGAIGRGQLRETQKEERGFQSSRVLQEDLDEFTLVWDAFT